ncbi:hypothetical protein GYMLUDRAFT_413684 [Collybiopsis luxurians FD-317 M1]|nr:hypothetical protein GYMLUDRAFT_413684 [Collybiopsis luxurians FD-317 M1]
MFQAQLSSLDSRHCSRFLEEDNPLALHGINSGTGASAIYLLLGCAIGKSWNFVASEIGPNSFGHARGIYQPIILMSGFSSFSLIQHFQSPLPYSLLRKRPGFLPTFFQ